jgi:hypothetical protein
LKIEEYVPPEYLAKPPQVAHPSPEENDPTEMIALELKKKPKN